ncbi:MAG: glycosyltransferase [Bacteroidetes bacterium]|nr:glycosyltransferase [Bacteroidota bacterium]
MKTKVIVFRHHLQSVQFTDEKIYIHPNEIRMDKIINRLGRKIVVPSMGVYKGMEQFEKVNLKKVSIIPYIYDFSKYKSPNPQKIEEIKTHYPCKLRLIMISRLVKLKRHHLVFPVIKELVQNGYDIKMLVLDQGPEKDNLMEYINNNGLSESIILIGYTNDFVNYMAACDLLIQPSLSDASNSAAKEMSLFGKPVAVSNNVGDYNDYVKDNVNSYLIPVSDSSRHIKNIILHAYNNPQKLIVMGELLKKEVISRFDASHASNIMLLYESLLK